MNQIPFWVEKNLLLSNREMAYFGAGDRLYALKQGDEVALSLSCTHQGCSVHKKVEANGEGFLCPCHGAAYDGQGQVLSGPAQENLAQFKVIQTEKSRIQLIGVSSVEDMTGRGETIEADYFIFAADIPGIRNLFALSSGKPHPVLVSQINELQVADPFAVGRFWFDRDFIWEQSWFTSLSGYRLTDSITLYHKIQGDYKQWAKETGGSVVELHAYCYKERDFLDQNALLATFEQELFEIVPALAGATILHRELVNQKNFSGFPPGSYANRPETSIADSNLMFAGDWVKMPFPCGLMERAVTSGLLAANTVLRREGAARRTLQSVSPEGLFKF